MKKISASKIKQFQNKILGFYKTNGRHDLPWRQTRDPYKILVSEIMLQQTQVDRVIPKYKEFLKKFGSVQKLADAELREVLVLWKGLGYNNRAKRLRDAMKIVVEKYKGKFPKDPETLDSLPGVGPYTARAVCAFAFSMPTVFIETNIRRIFIHEFFPKTKQVDDADILKLVDQTLYIKNPRDWYGALMDYGTYLKSQVVNPNKKSKHYTKQSKFQGSLRQGRASVLHMITEKGGAIDRNINKILEGYIELERKKIVNSLIKENMIIKKGNRYFLGE